LGREKESYTPALLEVLGDPKHIVTIGQPGKGKTNLNFLLISQFIKKNVPCWIWDREKLEYRELMNYFPDVQVFPMHKDFSLNPLEVPPKEHPIIWASTGVETFSRDVGLMEAGQSLLQTYVIDLYKERDVLNGSRNYPTLFDVYKKCQNPPFKGNSRQAGSNDSLLNRLSVILKTYPNLFSAQIGFSLEDLSKKTCVFEIGAFPQYLSRYLINIMLKRIFRHRVATQHQGGPTDLIALIDEAKYLFDPHFNKGIGLSNINLFMSQCRALQIGMIISDQSSFIDEAAFVNSHIKVFCGLGSGRDLQYASQILSLDRKQANYFHKLKRGEAIVRLPNVPDPVVVEIPRFSMKNF